MFTSVGSSFNSSRSVKFTCIMFTSVRSSTISSSSGFVLCMQIFKMPELCMIASLVVTNVFVLFCCGCCLKKKITLNAKILGHK